MINQEFIGPPDWKVCTVRAISCAQEHTRFSTLARAVGNKQRIYCLIYKGSVVLIYCSQLRIFSAVLRKQSHIARTRYKLSSLVGPKAKEENIKCCVILGSVTGSSRGLKVINFHMHNVYTCTVSALFF